MIFPNHFRPVGSGPGVTSQPAAPPAKAPSGLSESFLQALAAGPPADPTKAATLSTIHTASKGWLASMWADPGPGSYAGTSASPAAAAGESSGSARPAPLPAGPLDDPPGLIQPATTTGLTPAEIIAQAGAPPSGDTTIARRIANLRIRQTELGLDPPPRASGPQEGKALSVAELRARHAARHAEMDEALAKAKARLRGDARQSGAAASVPPSSAVLPSPDAPAPSGAPPSHTADAGAGEPPRPTPEGLITEFVAAGIAAALETHASGAAGGSGQGVTPRTAVDPASSTPAPEEPKGSVPVKYVPPWTAYPTPGVTAEEIPSTEPLPVKAVPPGTAYPSGGVAPCLLQ